MDAPETIYLADYTPFGWNVVNVDLTFKLAPNATRVTTKINLVPNPDGFQGEFFLHGEQLKLIHAKIDGVTVDPKVSEKGMTCAVPEGAFLLETEVEIDPAANTSLEGLYMSNGMYCTQCEAEGFRKIT
ncbi:MAG: aminopeptidase N, partial [Paracoccaceae bacterium]|nr:aminopeptidase N [Paracoccaceae bacterium]